MGLPGWKHLARDDTDARCPSPSTSASSQRAVINKLIEAALISERSLLRSANENGEKHVSRSICFKQISPYAPSSISRGANQHNFSISFHGGLSTLLF